MTRTPSIDAAALDAPMRRLLKTLSARKAWLEPTHPAGSSHARFRMISGLAGAAPVDVQVSPDVVQAATANGWLRHGEGRVILTKAGAQRLRRALAGGPGAGGPGSRKTGAARTRSGATGASPQKTTGARHGARTPPVATADTPGVNEAESPLGWLRRRKGRDGRPLIGDEQFAAGERLRADVFFAGLSPRVTASWSATAGTSSGRRSAPGGSAQMLDAMVAARQRVARAMRAVGPELSGILLDVCGFMKGLEGIEAERGWPARSGKVVLLLALSRLAAHYGLLQPGADRFGPPASEHSGRIRHWGADAYRPDQAMPRETEGVSMGSRPPEWAPPAAGDADQVISQSAARCGRSTAATTPGNARTTLH